MSIAPRAVLALTLVACNGVRANDMLDGSPDATGDAHTDTTPPEDGPPSATSFTALANTRRCL